MPISAELIRELCARGEGKSLDTHCDDADLHQKVGSFLNQISAFVYGPVDVDGKSVGVYRIRSEGAAVFPVEGFR